MLTINFIRHIAASNADLAYIIIALGMVLEGEVVVIFAGIFAHLGSLKFFWIALAIIVGGFGKSALGYGIGLYLRNKHSNKKFLWKMENRINYFLPNYVNKPFSSLFISRFLILSMHFFSLIFAGYKKINLKTFIKAESISLVVWSALILSLGYFFSYTALNISRDVRKFLGLILIFFIAFFILEKIIVFIIELLKSQKINTQDANF